MPCSKADCSPSYVGDSGITDFLGFSGPLSRLKSPHFFSGFGGSRLEAKVLIFARGSLPEVSPVNMSNAFSAGSTVTDLGSSSRIPVLLDCTSSTVHWMTSGSGGGLSRPLILRHCRDLSNYSRILNDIVF